MEYALLAIGVIIIILLIALLIIILRKNQKSLSTDEIAVSVKGEVLPAVRDELERSNSNLRSELNAQTQSSIKNMGDMVSDNQRSFTRSQGERLDKLEDRMNVLSESTERRLESSTKTATSPKSSSVRYATTTTPDSRKCAGRSTKSCKRRSRRR